MRPFFNLRLKNCSISVCKTMTASIITIGDEILIGQIVDTNSAWIAQHLCDLGIDVRCMMSIADTEDEIETTLRKALEQSQVVIVTGGLGPTNDDRTKQVLLRLFGGTMVSHEATLEHIRELFAQRGKPLTDSNRRQADVPSSCQVLFNASGTAPGMLFERDGHVAHVLPGHRPEAANVADRLERAELHGVLLADVRNRRALHVL